MKRWSTVWASCLLLSVARRMRWVSPHFHCEVTSFPPVARCIAMFARFWPRVRGKGLRLAAGRSQAPGAVTRILVARKQGLRASQAPGAYGCAQFGGSQPRAGDAATKDVVVWTRFGFFEGEGSLKVYISKLLRS